MAEKMRAMVLSNLAPIETKPLELQQINRHQIAEPHEILLKIEACGVCRSQLHGIEGDWKKYGIPPTLPTVPGHELVGKVIELGDAVKKFKMGDRAGISPLLGSCMKCEYCKMGKEHLCDAMDITGESLRGGYAEYITVNENFATFVPQDMKPEYAAPLFCAGITAYKAVKASEPSADKKVGIFGVGGVGHMAIQFAAVEGSRPVGISRSKNHLQVAEKLGAQVISYHTDQERFLDKLKNEVGLLDRAIVFAPAEAVTDTALKSVKKGGTVVIATFGHIPKIDVAMDEKTVRGTLIGSRKDMEEVVKIAGERKLQVISKTFPLEEANEVLTKLKNSEIEARAVLMP